MHNGFTSFEQPFGAYFSSFARATPYAIGQKPLFSLGRSIPPMFTLYSQTMLLFQHTNWRHRCFTVFAYLFQGNLHQFNAHPQLLSDSGPALGCSLAATRPISFWFLLLDLLICLSSVRGLVLCRQPNDHLIALRAAKPCKACSA